MVKFRLDNEKTLNNRKETVQYYYILERKAMFKEAIGIVGGFGAYATLDFYKRILEAFASDSERNYPHIIMDNNFTMPSRTRALIYDENYEEIVRAITDSIMLLMEHDASKIVLVCGTAHYFLDDVYQLLPEAKNRVVDIIDILGQKLQKKSVDNVLIIAAEGALKKGLYKKRLEKYGICAVQPEESTYEEIRYFIECVKQNRLSEDAIFSFQGFLEQYNLKNVVLGCTEFPVLVDYIVNRSNVLNGYEFYDPLETAICYIKEVMV